MPQLILLSLLAIVLALWWRGHWRRLQTGGERREFIARSLVIGLVLGIIALAALGRIDVLAAAFAGLLLCLKFLFAFALRHIPLLASLYGMSRGRVRRLRTAWLELQVDFATGTLAGQVLQGEFAGQPLDSLSRADLDRLLQQCAADARSAYLLRTYLAKRFGGTNAGGTPAAQADMSREQALEILGLEGDPDAAQVRRAHKQLMQRLHPDRGGNDFLAALLNRARERLLG
ncbi:MAG: molecular chaperone DnaJ [Cellvibrionales bacterium]|nr:molecular chaperone DnaJ [Cellvibrionales bacterium]